MNIYYEVKEHLIVSDCEKQCCPVYTAQHQLSLLAAWILRRDAQIFNLTVCTDEKEYHFSGNELNKTYQELMDAMLETKTLEITAEYDYESRCGAAGPGPFAMIELLREDAENDPKSLEGLFYSCYQNADCSSEGAGFVTVYGEKNGVFYNGELPFRPACGLTDGDWYTPISALAYDLNLPSDRDLAVAEKTCLEMGRFSTYDSLEKTENSFSFYLNNLRLKNDAEFKEFMGLYKTLLTQTNGTCSLIGELADVSSPEVKLARFDLDENGDLFLEIAQVEN